MKPSLSGAHRACVACALIAAGALCLFPPIARADVVIGDFEGDLNAGSFGAWDPDHTVIDDDPEALAGFVSTPSFITDDPLTTASEGVTLGSQALLIEHYQWEDGYKPYLALIGGNDPRQAILDSTSLELDITPIAPEVGSISWRQAFLAISFGNDSPDPFFGAIQRDWEEGTVNEFDEPLPFRVNWNFNLFVQNDLDNTQADTFKGWAQAAIDADEELQFFLILQGRDQDENELEIGWNPFNPTSVKTVIDNVEFVGLPSTSLPGDANGDGAVDILDLDILSGNFGTTGGATVATGDFNADGNVDILDLDILSGNFGAGGAASAATPEPGSGVMALLAALASASAARRRGA